MPKWCMSCKGETAGLTSELNPANPKDRAKLYRTKIVVCGRCWRRKTWEY